MSKWIYEDNDVEAIEINGVKYVPERTCRIEKRRGGWYCTECDELVGTVDTESEFFIDGNAIEMWTFCPNCGCRVKED